VRDVNCTAYAESPDPFNPVASYTVEWSVALTKRGVFATYSESEFGTTRLTIHDSLAKAVKEGGLPPEVAAAANSKLGIESIIELDI
jgi:hypothetical protein